MAAAAGVDKEVKQGVASVNVLLVVVWANGADQGEGFRLQKRRQGGRVHGARVGNLGAVKLLKDDYGIGPRVWPQFQRFSRDMILRSSALATNVTFDRVRPAFGSEPSRIRASLGKKRCCFPVVLGCYTFALPDILPS